MKAWVGDRHGFDPRNLVHTRLKSLNQAYTAARREPRRQNHADRAVSSPIATARLAGDDLLPRKPLL